MSFSSLLTVLEKKIETLESIRIFRFNKVDASSGAARDNEISLIQYNSKRSAAVCCRDTAGMLFLFLN